MKEQLPLHILVIEDQLGDYTLIQDYLIEEHNTINLTRAMSFTEAKELLAGECVFNAILLDLSLPDSSDSEKLVRNVVSISKGSPVIVLTGNCNKDFGVETLSQGISDYLLKDDLNPIQLSKSIYYSIERKKIENQLSKSEKKYKTLFDQSPLPKFVLDLHSLDFLNVNKAAVNLYGYSLEEFLTMNVRDLWVKEDEQEIENKWLNCYKDYFQLSLRHRKKNGEIINIEISSNPIDFEGKEARVTLIKDITAQLKAEQDLLNSERRFKALVQEGSELLIIMDFSGNLSYASPSSAIVMGVDSETLLQNNFFFFIHSEDVNKVEECIEKLKDHKRIQMPSYRIKTPDNKWRWIETILTNLTADPAIGGIVANSRDITDFVKQEKALMESLNRYDVVAKATSDTITDYNVEKDIMEFNEGIHNMFGYSLEQVRKNGSWWEERVHPEDIERVKASTRQIYKNKENQLQIEYRFRCANGTYKHILDRSYLLKDDEGNPLRMIGSMQDITEIQNYIETIENHNARLKEIAWTQSHVVRAPLARIMGLIDLLQNHEEIENQCQLLDSIISSAHELDSIIRKISSKAEYPTETLF